MIERLISLIIISLLAPRSMAECVFADSAQMELKEIHEARKTVFKDRSFSQLSYIMRTKTILLDHTVVEICPSIDKKFLYDSKTQCENPFLGIGGYAAVFKVAVDGQKKAVKMIRFSDYLERYLTNYKQYIQGLEGDCLKGVIQRASLIELIKNPGTGSKFGKITVTKEDFRLFITDILKNLTCPNLDSENLLTVTTNIANRFVNLFQQEAETSLKLSRYSELNENAAHRSFHKTDKCIIDKHMNIYILMEQLGVDFFEVRSKCPSSIGFGKISGRILLFLRILYKIAKLHERGFIHCDIKIENLVFELVTGFEEPYLADYGLVSTGQPCTGGSKGYLSPELIAKDYLTENVHFTKFITPVNNQADSFAVGMLMASFQLNRDSYFKLNEQVKEISKSLDKNEFKEEEKKFVTKLEQRIKETNHSFTGDDIKINQMLNNIIKKLLIFDPFERYPVQIAMYILYQLYLYSILSNAVDHRVLKEVITNPELVNILQIASSKKNEHDTIETIAKSGEWSLNSKPYKMAVKAIEELLEVKTGEHMLVEGYRII
jgi:serine/threonine protein kinase